MLESLKGFIISKPHKQLHKKALFEEFVIFYPDKMCAVI